MYLNVAEIESAISSLHAVYPGVTEVLPPRPTPPTRAAWRACCGSGPGRPTTSTAF